MPKMFHVTAPHPSIPKRMASGLRSPNPKRTLLSRVLENGIVSNTVRTAQIVCPILGCLIYVASFASEDWIVTNSLYCWGLLTMCQPQGNLTNATVLCEYMAPGDSAAYFEAAQGLACLAFVLYLVLQFHLKLIEVKLCYHQLPAIVALLTTCLIAVVLLLVETNYRQDSRWKDKEPSLGWSYWIALLALIFSLLAAIALFCRGHQERTKTQPKDDHPPRKHTQVHPAKQSHDNKTSRDDDDIVAGENRGTQAGGHQTGDPEYPKRNWKRKLSPILERGDRLPEIQHQGRDQGTVFQASTSSAD